MRLLRWATFCVVVGTLPAIGLGLRAQGPVVGFHTIGDLPGGYTFSTVRDATKVGDVIYAVGGSANMNQAPSVFGADTPILWTREGTNLPVLTALPHLATPSLPQTPMLAQAITPDAQYIASMARNSATSGSRVATRVTMSDLATLSLTSTSASSAQAISDNGSILYGTVGSIAVRFDVDENTGTVTTTPIPVLSGATASGLANRGASFNGSVAVGTSSTSAGAQAFRYVHGTGVSAIPRLSGGTFNRALAVSRSGNLTLVSGDTPSVPNGAIYTYDTTVPAAPVLTTFGSPNTAWLPGVSGGITADGSVVTVNYFPAGTGQFGPRFAYFHNRYGWFPLASALAAGGVDVTSLPLEQLVVNGISPDGTLVYGQGRREGPDGQVIEGFVAEFPAGFLADFDVPPTPPANSAIVGAWYAADTTSDPTVANPVILVFLADGTYFHIEANHPASEATGTNGFERGRYKWDAPATSSSGAFSLTTLQDTNGDIGFSDATGRSGITLDVAGDTLTISIAGCDPVPDPEECFFSATRVTGGPLSPLAGGWIFGNPLVEDGSVLLVLLGNGDYYFAQDGSSEPPPAGDPNGRDGIEKGTWAWNPATGEFSSRTTVDTNGEWGLNSTFPLAPAPGNLNAVLPLVLSPDGLRLTITDGIDSYSARRVAVVATATPTGTDVPVVPISPTGDSVATITFDEVTEGGETTLQVVDPNTVADAPMPPAGFSLGDPPLYYEIDTTATFTGPVTVCFNYGGVTFASGTPRLLHYDEDLQSWVDITTSVDLTATTICGLTSSFSPFAIAASQVTSSGFAHPISPVGSYQNVVRGGSTVPLKFNVFVNGVEKTGTSGLTFSAVQVGCTADSGETPIVFETTGGTSLRYTGGQFVQNWLTPTAPGCYFVRVTGDGLLLSAVFKVK
jgi:hypothetical protein